MLRLDPSGLRHKALLQTSPMPRIEDTSSEQAISPSWSPVDVVIHADSVSQSTNLVTPQSRGFWSLPGSIVADLLRHDVFLDHAYCCRARTPASSLARFGQQLAVTGPIGRTYAICRLLSQDMYHRFLLCRTFGGLL